MTNNTLAGIGGVDFRFNYLGTGSMDFRVDYLGIGGIGFRVNCLGIYRVDFKADCLWLLWFRAGVPIFLLVDTSRIILGLELDLKLLLLNLVPVNIY
jgi:hypothetical protein